MGLPGTSSKVNGQLGHLLDHDHYEGVFKGTWVDAREWYAFDEDSDNTDAFNTAWAELRTDGSGAGLSVPAGTWPIEGVVQWGRPAGFAGSGVGSGKVGLRGAGNDVTVILGANAAANFRVESLDDSSDQITAAQSGAFAYIDFDGDGVATQMLYIGLIANRTFQRVHVFRSTQDNIVIEAAQNSRFEGLLSTNAGRDNLRIDAGAQDLSFWGANLSAGGRRALYITQSKDHPTNTSQSEPDAIRFFGGIMERGSLTDAKVVIDCGDGIFFNQCEITGKYRAVQLKRIQDIHGTWLPNQRIVFNGGRLSAKDGTTGDYCVECVGDASASGYIEATFDGGVSLTLANIAAVRGDIYTRVIRGAVRVETSVPTFWQGHTAGVDDPAVRGVDRVRPAGGGPICITKAATDSHASTTGLVDDTELVWTILEKGTYKGRVKLLYDGPSAADLKVAMAATGGGVAIVATVVGLPTSATAATDSAGVQNAKAASGDSTAVGSTGATGTAQAGDATHITLASGASAVDDFYNGQTIYLTSGTGAGATGITILDYVGATKVALVASWPVATPDNTTVYDVTAVHATFIDFEASFTSVPSTPLKVRHAQATSNAGATHVLPGSTLEIYEHPETARLS